MSELFEALRTIRAKRDAAGREYTRVAIAVREPTPMRQPLPVSRPTLGVVRGLLTFLGGAILAAFATALWWDWPARDAPASALSVAAVHEAPPSRAAPAVERSEPAAVAVVAAVAAVPERSLEPEMPVKEPLASADPPAAPERLRASPPSGGDFWVQLGAFAEHDNASRFHAELLQKRLRAVIRPGRTDAPSWLVAVGPYGDERAAAEARTALAREGLSGFVLRGNR